MTLATTSRASGGTQIATTGHAAPDEVPAVLIDQLAQGGVLVAPGGPSAWSQSLLRYRKTGDVVSREKLGAVRFVPMVANS